MRRAVLIFLYCLATCASAQLSAPTPEPANLIRQAILRQRVAESKEQDYVFREDTNDIRLKKECTWAPKCPAPFGVPDVKGVAFQVVQYDEHHFEVFWLDGVRVARVLPSCDHCGRETTGSADSFIMNIPISDSELAVENERVDREVAEAQALRAQGKDASSTGDPPQILLSRMLELCSFSNPRRQIIDGRSTILLDFVWNPSMEPASANEALLKAFSGTIGIDEEEQAVQHVEGKFLTDVNLDAGNIKIRKGTRITITNRRVDTGIWMQSRLDAWGEGRYFAFAIDGAGHIFTGSYRKFTSTSRILAVSALEPANPSGPVGLAKAQLAPPNQAQLQSDRNSAQGPQVRGYWIDATTGLMWAAKDNGRNVNWKKAMNYCRDMRLAGYSDWRLASLVELEGIYDKSANSPGLARLGGPATGSAFSWHVRGNLFLTGNQWSSSRIPDDRGHPSGYAWRFDFNEGRSFDGDEESFSTNKRALCVRGSGR